MQPESEKAIAEKEVILRLPEELQRLLEAKMEPELEEVMAEPIAISR